MKIRQGFVSNSSSSSFVVLLPEGFSNDDFKKLLDAEVSADTLCEDSDDLLRDSVMKAFKSLMRGGISQEDGDYESYQLLTDILDDYIIAEVSVDSSSGGMDLADIKQIKKILNITEAKHENS